MSVKIIVDSGCDILPSEAEKLGIEVIPLKTCFEDGEFLDGVELTPHKFYEKLIECEELPKTSQITPAEYEKAFSRIKADGDTAVCITISSKLSGCYQSALIAGEDYPEIVVVDSKNVSFGERILVEYAISLLQKGMSASEIADNLNLMREKIRVIALLDTLEYLKKGGRISSAAALAGSVLSIKPVVSVVDGEVVMLGKARGSKNGNNMLMSEIEKANGICFNMPLCLAYSGLTDELLKKYISDSRHIYEGKTEQLRSYPIGSTIGTHIGPGAIAVAFYAND